MYGIDINGVLPISKGATKYAIIAVDYSTKLVEAELLATITIKKAINFIVENIICHFGVPCAIVTDNGTEFDSTEFKDFYSRIAYRRDLLRWNIHMRKDKLKL